MDHKTYLLALMAKGETEKVIKQLLEATQQNGQNDVYNDIIGISARFYSNEKSNKMGVISSEDYRLESNKIRSALQYSLENYKPNGNFVFDESDSGAQPPTPPPTQNTLKKILMFTANPAGTAKLNLDKEHSQIALKLQGRQAVFPLITERAVDKTSFREKVYLEKPAFLHFSGHGEAVDNELTQMNLPNGGLIVQNDDHNGYETLSSDVLEVLFEYFREEGISLSAVVLNACWSENQASAISKHVPFVIGTTQKIKDTFAIAFSVGFYFRLAESYPQIDIPAAFKSGRTAAVLAGASKSDFVIYQNAEKVQI
ncbi:MAG: CHAT domain-containing protein [Bacteroidia bacterium]|nr:CHAT domain-containing protein [Bacteroidia bacterium]